MKKAMMEEMKRRQKESRNRSTQRKYITFFSDWNAVLFGLAHGM
jgi:hypothetical protein